MKFIYLFLTFIFSSNVPSVKKTITVCGRKFLTKKAKVFLKDDNVEVVMVSALDLKTKKFVFGFVDSTFRNDSLLTYSYIIEKNQEMQITEVYNYKNIMGIDSAKKYFNFNKSKLKFIKVENYRKDEIINTINFNEYIN